MADPTLLTSGFPNRIFGNGSSKTDDLFKAVATQRLTLKGFALSRSLIPYNKTSWTHKNSGNAGKVDTLTFLGQHQHFPPGSYICANLDGTLKITAPLNRSIQNRSDTLTIEVPREFLAHKWLNPSVPADVVYGWAPGIIDMIPCIRANISSLKWYWSILRSVNIYGSACLRPESIPMI